MCFFLRTVCWSTNGRMRLSTASTCPHKSWPTWTKRHQNCMAPRLYTAQATRTFEPHLNIVTAMGANPGTALQSSASLPFYHDHRYRHVHRSWDCLLRSLLGPTTEAGRGVVTLFGVCPCLRSPGNSCMTGAHCALSSQNGEHLLCKFTWTWKRKWKEISWWTKNTNQPNLILMTAS